MKPTAVAHSSGHGFVAVVNTTDEHGEVLAYSSAEQHGEAGVFGLKREAHAHAKAYAKALEELEEAQADHAQDLKLRWFDADAIATGHTAKDRETLDVLLSSAKDLKGEIKARSARLVDLKTAAHMAKVEIVWTDKGDPGAVEVQATENAFDQEDPETGPSPLQLGMPEMTWSVLEEAGQVQRVAGYGQAVLAEVDGKMLLTLGGGEVVLEIDGARRHSAGNVVALKDYKRGKLKAAQLIQRLHAFDLRPETLLALYKVEAESKPRAEVVAALIDQLCEVHHSALIDAQSIDDGRKPKHYILDMASAEVLTASGEISALRLEELAVSCQDLAVIGWLIDGERDRDEPRDLVLDMLVGRRGEIEALAAKASG